MLVCVATHTGGWMLLAQVPVGTVFVRHSSDRVGIDDLADQPVSVHRPLAHHLLAFAPSCAGNSAPSVNARSPSSAHAGGWALCRYLWDNALTGTIPTEMGLMASLTSL
jgi:hypothetical protein